MDTPMWDYSGSTIVSNNEIRLTPDHQSKAGRVWNTVVSNVTLYIYGSVNMVIGNITLYMVVYLK